MSCWAWPSGDRPPLMTLVIPGTVARFACRCASAATSADVSDPLVVAATTGIGRRFDVPKGLASSAACELAALAGRNFWLFPWVTLDRAGSCVEAAIAPTIQTSSTTHRN